ncbi:MAG: hypothetical protein WCP12_14030 [bacterium]
MKNRKIVFVGLMLLSTGALRAADAVEWAKVTAQSTNAKYQPYLAVDGQFDHPFAAWISEPYGGGTKEAPKDVWWMLEMPHKIRVQGVKIIGDSRSGSPFPKNLRVDWRDGEMWKTAGEVRDAKSKTITVTWPEPVETTTLRVFFSGRDVPVVVRITELLLILPGGEEKTVPAILGLSPIQASIPNPGPEFPNAAAAGLPAFKYQGVVLDYKGLKFNPCDDVIVPSVISTEKLQKPLGRYYMYYAPHNMPGGICLAYADTPEGPWKEYLENPIISRDWQPHYKVSHVSGPHAIWMEEEGKLFVYYHGENNVTRFASTTDGIHFKYEDVAFTTKMFEGLSEASYARMFRYTIHGKDNRYIALIMGNNKGTRRIYMATSKDGRVWEPRQTPLVDPPPGTDQIANASYLPWNGKHYIIYHAHWTVQNLVADLHVSEVDPAFEQSKYVGLLYDHKAAGLDNVAQMSANLLKDNGKLYLYVNIGPRLHQKISLAIAPGENSK